MKIRGAAVPVHRLIAALESPITKAVKHGNYDQTYPGGHVAGAAL